MDELHPIRPLALDMATCSPTTGAWQEPAVPTHGSSVAIQRARAGAPTSRPAKTPGKKLRAFSPAKTRLKCTCQRSVDRRPTTATMLQSNCSVGRDLGTIVPSPAVATHLAADCRSRPTQFSCYGCLRRPGSEHPFELVALVLRQPAVPVHCAESSRLRFERVSTAGWLLTLVVALALTI